MKCSSRLQRCEATSACTFDGSWDGLLARIREMAPSPPKRNVEIQYPYGTCLVPSWKTGTTYLGRNPPETWRYGSGYILPNPGKVYGEPDFKYYSQEYSGPCGCCNTPPGWMGQPFGGRKPVDPCKEEDNGPSIRYIPFEGRNLIAPGIVPNPDCEENAGSGMKMLLQEETPPPLTPKDTSCGKHPHHHHPKTSGVHKNKNEHSQPQPVKFQITFGNQMPPNPQISIPGTIDQPRGSSSSSNCGVVDKGRKKKITLPSCEEVTTVVKNVRISVCPTAQKRLLRSRLQNQNQC